MAIELFRVDTDGNPYLVGGRCRSCGGIGFPKRPVCAYCFGDDVEEAAVGRRGVVKSSCIVHNAPIGFVAPYILANVTLEEGPIVFCPLTGCPPEDDAVKPGTPVSLVIAPARPEGDPVFQFRP